MQFTARLLAFSAAFSQVLALPVLTNSAYDVTEGEAFDITWTNATGDVTLTLKTGISTDLTTVSTIASGLTGDSYEWTPEDIPSGTYAIAITDGSGETNYSPQFTYQGTGVVSTTSASASASATSTTTTTSSGTTTATVTSASGSTTLTSTATGSSNGTTTASSTMSTSTKSSSSATTTSSSSSSSSTPINTNDSQKVGSPLALILLTAAALMICH